MIHLHAEVDDAGREGTDDMPILRRAGAATMAAGDDRPAGAGWGRGLLARRPTRSGGARLLASTARVRGVVAQCLDVARRLAVDLIDPYRPELHYMRGPGPRWRAKHGCARSCTGD
jgi:hypothetical protein